MAARGTGAAAEQIGASGCSWARSRTVRRDRPASRLFSRGCSNWAGPRERNVRIDFRWPGAGNADDIRKYAAELVALAPDVILATGSISMAPLLQMTRAVPIVFVQVVDPVGSGFVDSLARPGGNATGFRNFEYGLSAKWLELLKQIAPGVTRVAVLRDPTAGAGNGQFGAIQTAAQALGVEVNPVNMRDASEIERAVTTFARAPNGGLIVPGSALANFHRDLIIALAAAPNLPAAYANRSYVTAGGLISYGVQTGLTNTVAWPAMSIASSRARSRPICLSSCRPISSW